MITLFYGDDSNTSREKFFSAKKAAHAPLSLSNEELSLTTLKQICEGGMLFSETKDVFLENFFTKVKKNKQQDDMIAYLNSQEEKQNFFIFEGKDLLKTATNSFPKAILVKSKLANTLFQFLDAFIPGNPRLLISLFNQTLQTTDIEIVFSMLCRQIRIFIALQDEACETEEIKRLAPWQKEKIQKQAKSFSLEKLRHIHEMLYRLDHDRKTGTLPTTFPVCIDFFLLELYH
jgi:hypothetical protein